MQEALNRIDLEGHNRLEGLRTSGAKPEAIAAAQREIDSKRKAAIDAELAWVTRHLAEAQASQEGAGSSLMGRLDREKYIGLASQYGAGLARMSDLTGLTIRNQDLTGEARKAQDKVDADAAGKKAAADQIKSSEEQLAAIQTRSTMTQKAVADFWQHLAATDTTHGALYREATKRANTALGAQFKQDSQELGASLIGSAKQSEENNDKISDALYATFKGAVAESERQTKQMQEAAVAAFKQAEETRKAADRVEEERIKLEMASGRLSRLEGARALQGLHDSSYADWQKAAGDFRWQFPDIATPGAAQTMRDYGVDRERDAHAVASATALDALETSARQLAAEFTDVGQIASRELVQAIHGFNDVLVGKMVGDRGASFRQFGENTARSLSGSALRYAEGLLLGKVPNAKLGTRENRMYTSTVIESGAGTAGGGEAGGLLGKLLAHFGLGGDSSQLIGSLIGALPAFAGGGEISSNMPALVGESGPEIFMPSTAGRIIPNDAIGGQAHTWNIDARGTDPALSRANFERALRQTHAQAVNDSAHAMAQRQMRRPH